MRRLVSHARCQHKQISSKQNARALNDTIKRKEKKLFLFISRPSLCSLTVFRQPSFSHQSFCVLVFLLFVFVSLFIKRISSLAVSGHLDTGATRTPPASTVSHTRRYWPTCRFVPDNTDLHSIFEMVASSFTHLGTGIYQYWTTWNGAERNDKKLNCWNAV